MKTLVGYGIVLKPITHADIEMVRCWRNDPEISRYMYFREYITPDMQEEWFKSITDRNDIYFIINIDGRPVGMTEYKKINYEDKTAEGGIFIYEKQYQNGPYAYSIVAVRNNYGFNDLGLRVLFAYIMDDNLRAIRFNQSLGYKPTDIVYDGIKRLYTLTCEDYYKNFRRYQKFLDNIL